MGKRSCQRKNALMLDTQDDDCGVCSMWVPANNDQVLIHKDTLLDESLDALYEKRSSIREKALLTIIVAFNSNLQYQFVENKFATLLHQCLSSIKWGSAKEICLTAHAIGLLALTVGGGDNAREMLEESTLPLSQALESVSESSKISLLLECLAIVTFVGGNDSAETEKAMEIMWQLVHPKLGSNVVGKKPTAATITAVVSSWSFLLATMDGWTLNSKQWQATDSYFSSLLDKDDWSVCIAAGEALALTFELGRLEKFSVEGRDSSDGSIQGGNKSQEGFVHIQGLKVKVLNQVRNLAVEAGGKGSTKKVLNSQRNLFRDLLEFLEGYCPETSMKIGGDPLHTSTWSQLIQLNFLKHFLGAGFVKHMQENEFLQDVVGFTPKKKYVLGNEHHISSTEKRMSKSPNSVQNKARTQFLNKQRMLSKVLFFQ